MQLSKTHIHFMGISGIGMSGIAKILRQQGHIVSGCDTGADHHITKDLQNLGCKIANEHNSDYCFDETIKILVYNSFIPKNHPELLRGKDKGILILHRAQMLAQIMKDKKSIGIAGSHGKTSTSALMGHLLRIANEDPTIIVGGVINTIGSNAHWGTGNLLVAETDESDRSLLLLPKTYSIITNIDIEHLETYKDFEDIKETFLQFANNIPDHGMSALCLDDHGVRSILPNITTPYITYGQSHDADIQMQNVSLSSDSSTFNIYQKSSLSILGQITLSQPGIHYALNATGTIALALHLNIPFTIIQQALSIFHGVDRRFSYKGVTSLHGAHIFDDYGHHPLAIDYALAVARNKAINKLVVVFQPHRFSRTKHLWNDFVTTFSSSTIDTLIITDIYPAFEEPIESITSQNIVEGIKKLCPKKIVIYCPFSKEMCELENTINATLKKDDLLLLLGAGKINDLAKKLLK